MSYFFSKIELRRDSESLKKLNHYMEKSGYYYHQLIWKLFSDGNKKNRDFIYRAQFEGQWPIFFTVSKTPPSDQERIWNIESKPYHPVLKTEQHLRFILRVNPQVTGKRQSDQKKVRYDVIQNAVFGKENNVEKITAQLIQTEGEAWLKARDTKNGFRVISVIAHNFSKERFYKRSQKNPITFSTLEYEGILEVIEPTVFLQTLFNGMGSAKGFGCGLLMVKN